MDDLAFTTGILSHLNAFNKSLQVTGLFIHDCYQKLKEFMNKLHGWSLEVPAFKIESFERINVQKEGLSIDQYIKYKDIIDQSITDLSGRFADFRKFEADFEALSNIADIAAQRTYIQPELFELQSNSEYKDQLRTTSLKEWFSSLDETKFHNIKT